MEEKIIPAVQKFSFPIFSWQEVTSVVINQTEFNPQHWKLQNATYHLMISKANKYINSGLMPQQEWTQMVRVQLSCSLQKGKQFPLIENLPKVNQTYNLFSYQGNIKHRCWKQTLTSKSKIRAQKDFMNKRGSWAMFLPHLSLLWIYNLLQLMEVEAKQEMQT